MLGEYALSVLGECSSILTQIKVPFGTRPNRIFIGADSSFTGRAAAGQASGSEAVNHNKIVSGL